MPEPWDVSCEPEIEEYNGYVPSLEDLTDEELNDLFDEIYGDPNIQYVEMEDN